MSPVFHIVAKRTLLGLVTLLVVSLVIFLSVEILPGDYAKAFLMRFALPDTVAAYRHQLGLNEPSWWRFLQWLGGALSGDLGRSYSNNTPVFEMIWPRFGNSLFLAGYAAILAIPLSLILGLVMVLYKDSLLDRVMTAITLVAVSIPEFFMAYILVAVMSVGFWTGSDMVLGGLFPPISVIADELGFGEAVYRTTLPAITLTLVMLAHTMRMTKASIIAVLSSDYIEMARLKGLKRWRIVVFHAFPNAIAPIINVVTFNLAYLVTGVVIIEVVFVYPGLGSLLVDMASMRNVPVVQGACLLFASVFVILNLLADVLSVLTNPRLLYPSSGR
jgi:peptide/nickel transport system permease protein